MFSLFSKKSQGEISSPVKGVIKKIEDVNDPVFSTKMMGEGVAVQYELGDVYAPLDGEVTTIILPSCHAFGIKSKEGLELLVHVGLETVKLNGEGFKLLKEKGDSVKKGEKILQIDLKLLEKRGIDLVTPIVVTNSSEFDLELVVVPEEEVTQGTTLIKYKKK